MDDAARQATLRRLRRIEGQVKGLARMVEEDRYCIDILHQVSSVQQALHGVARTVMDGHLRHCVRQAMRAEDPAVADAAVEEILDTVYSIRKR